MSKTLIGVMGPGNDALQEDIDAAFELGRRIAEAGWVLLTGGRRAGVMDAANRGAKQAKGLTVGILPGDDRTAMSTAVDIPIIIGMGQARNNINVLSSQVVIACGIGAGTAAEIALALKARKQVVLLRGNSQSREFFQKLGGDQVVIADSPRDAIEIARTIISASQEIP